MRGEISCPSTSAFPGVDAGKRGGQAAVKPLHWRPCAALAGHHAPRKDTPHTWRFVGTSVISSDTLPAHGLCAWNSLTTAPARVGVRPAPLPPCPEPHLAAPSPPRGLACKRLTPEADPSPLPPSRGISSFSRWVEGRQRWPSMSIVSCSPSHPQGTAGLRAGPPAATPGTQKVAFNGALGFAYK